VVSPVLWSRNIRRLDAVALTHAHSDHMGGMPSVLRNFRPRVLWVGSNPDIPAYEALLAEAQELGIPIESMAAGSTLLWRRTGRSAGSAVDYPQARRQQ
jgi:competence protein ComEC